MAFSKLEAMAIYLVKQACGNDKLACVLVITKCELKRFCVVSLVGVCLDDLNKGYFNSKSRVQCTEMFTLFTQIDFGKTKYSFLNLEIIENSNSCRKFQFFT